MKISKIGPGVKTQDLPNQCIAKIGSERTVNAVANILANISITYM